MPDFLKAVLIDDEKWTLEVLRSLGDFKGCGIEVVGEASDGEHGLELIHQLRPDIILTDVKMPRMNGLELAERLKEEGSSARIIFVSGYDDYEYVHRALKAGAADYILKPVKEEEFNRALHAAADALRENGAADEKGSLRFSFPDREWAGRLDRALIPLEEDLRTGDEKGLSRDLASLRDIAMEQDGVSAEIYAYSLLIDRLLSLPFDSGDEPRFLFEEGSTMEELLDFSEECVRKAARRYKSAQEGKRRFSIEPVKAYIEEHYRETSLSLESIARRFGVSREYLSRAYKKEYGRGLWETVISLRLSKAKELIEQGNMPLKDIASYVGYDDVHNFYRAFKKRYGVPPGSCSEVNK